MRVDGRNAPGRGSAHADGRAGLTAMLADVPDIDAVFCSSSMLALGVLTEARARGISVPQ